MVLDVVRVTILFLVKLEGVAVAHKLFDKEEKEFLNLGLWKSAQN